MTQTIPDCIGLKLYISPNFITENNNGDIVVSDFASGALVVTNREGKYRFSYPANRSELRLKPNGNCTDALSHILVCDKTTNTLHMLNKDGRFLSHLLILPSGINNPYNLRIRIVWFSFVNEKENKDIAFFLSLSHKWEMSLLCPKTCSFTQETFILPSWKQLYFYVKWLNCLPCTVILCARAICLQNNYIGFQIQQVT